MLLKCKQYLYATSLARWSNSEPIPCKRNLKFVFNIKSEMRISYVEYWWRYGLESPVCVSRVRCLDLVWLLGYWMHKRKVAKRLSRWIMKRLNGFTPFRLNTYYVLCSSHGVGFCLYGIVHLFTSYLILIDGWSYEQEYTQSLAATQKALPNQ